MNPAFLRTQLIQTQIFLKGAWFLPCVHSGALHLGNMLAPVSSGVLNLQTLCFLQSSSLPGRTFPRSGLPGLCSSPSSYEFWSLASSPHFLQVSQVPLVPSGPTQTNISKYTSCEWDGRDSCHSKKFIGEESGLFFLVTMDPLTPPRQRVRARPKYENRGASPG